MKLRILASVLVFAAVTSAPASAMISKQNVSCAVNSAVSSGSLTTIVSGGVVTLYGNVDSAYDAHKAANAALNVAGVDRVINRITTSN